MTKVKIKETTSRDSIIKNILTSTDAGLNYLAMIVCKILDLSYDDFTFSLIHPNVSVNENIINSEVDIAMQNNDMIVNVEVNSTKGRKIERKNNNYICQLILKQTKKSSDYKSKYKKVYQINLNAFDITKDDRFVVISRLVDTKTHQEIHPFLEIVDVNLAKIIKTSYTSVKEKESLEKLLYLLVCNDEQVLRNVYDGDDLMEKMVDEAKSLTSDFDSMLYYDAEALKDASSYELGEETGRNEEKKSIVVNMIKENADISFIARVSGLSIEEIEDIKKEMNL